MSGGLAGVEYLQQHAPPSEGPPHDAVLTAEAVPGDIAVFSERLDQARQRQRDDVSSTVARAQLQTLARTRNPDVNTAYTELRLLETERRGLMRDEVRTQLWNDDLMTRLAHSPPRPESKYYAALNPGRMQASPARIQPPPLPSEHGVPAPSPLDTTHFINVEVSAHLPNSQPHIGGARSASPAGTREDSVQRVAEYLCAVNLPEEDLHAAYRLAARRRNQTRAGLPYSG